MRRRGYHLPHPGRANRETRIRDSPAGQEHGVLGPMHHLLLYIDPGSGSLIIQAVIATIVAIPFFFRQQIGRFVRTVRHTDTPPAPQESGDSPDSPS